MDELVKAVVWSVCGIFAGWSWVMISMQIGVSFPSCLIVAAVVCGTAVYIDAHLQKKDKEDMEQHIAVLHRALLEAWKEKK
jgi:hypothetical protein